MNEFAVLRAARKNPVAKAVRTPQFRMRVVPLMKRYNRPKANRDWRNDL